MVKTIQKNVNITFINSFMREVLSYRNQSIDLLSKSMDRFLYDRGLRHERVKCWRKKNNRKNPEHVHSHFPGSINNGSPNNELGKNKRARLKITEREIF